MNAHAHKHACLQAQTRAPTHARAHRVREVRKNGDLITLLLSFQGMEFN